MSDKDQNNPLDDPFGESSEPKSLPSQPSPPPVQPSSSGEVSNDFPTVTPSPSSSQDNSFPSPSPSSSQDDFPSPDFSASEFAAPDDFPNTSSTSPPPSQQTSFSSDLPEMSGQNVSAKSGGGSGTDNVLKVLFGLSGAMIAGVFVVVCLCMCLCVGLIVLIVATAEDCSGGACLVDEYQDASIRERMEVGEAATGQITSTNRAERWTVALDAGQRYSITLSNTSGDLDPELAIYDANGTYLTHDSTSFDAFIRIFFTPTASGDYQILVSNWGFEPSSMNASYELTVVPN